MKFNKEVFKGDLAIVILFFCFAVFSAILAGLFVGLLYLNITNPKTLLIDLFIVLIGLSIFGYYRYLK